jgi:hypothetical protein
LTTVTLPVACGTDPLADDRRAELGGYFLELSRVEEVEHACGVIDSKTLLGTGRVDRRDT